MEAFFDVLRQHASLEPFQAPAPEAIVVVPQDEVAAAKCTRAFLSTSLAVHAALLLDTARALWAVTETLKSKP